MKPARIAFDHIEDRDIYERALRLCAKNGIAELSNYVLYNSEDFGGKGRTYHADTPADLYNRMRITLDLVDELNAEYGVDQRIDSFLVSNEIYSVVGSRTWICWISMERQVLTSSTKNARSYAGQGRL